MLLRFWHVNLPCVKTLTHSALRLSPSNERVQFACLFEIIDPIVKVTVMKKALKKFEVALHSVPEQVLLESISELECRTDETGFDFTPAAILLKRVHKLKSKGRKKC